MIKSDFFVIPPEKVEFNPLALSVYFEIETHGTEKNIYCFIGGFKKHKMLYRIATYTDERQRIAIIKSIIDTTISDFEMIIKEYRFFLEGSS